MPKKLLLADDSITIQRVIELTFADEDVEVIAVSDGRQAIERLEREPPDIVLADVGMPQVDGYGVARYIKSKPHLARIPVILLAGAFGPIDEARARDAGYDGVLAKPFEPQQAIARVRELLARSAAAPGAPAVKPAPASADGDRRNVLDELPLQIPAPQPALKGADVTALDEYFDRLSHDLSAATSPPASVPADRRATGASAPPVSAAQPRQEVAATYAGPPPAPADGLSIADAFAALLAAEDGAQPPPVHFALTDELIDAIATRVVERLSGDVVTDIVTRVAERLVRDEIEKIKSGA